MTWDASAFWDWVLWKDGDWIILVVSPSSRHLVGWKFTCIEPCSCWMKCCIRCRSTAPEGLSNDWEFSVCLLFYCYIFWFIYFGMLCFSMTSILYDSLALYQVLRRSSVGVWIRLWWSSWVIIRDTEKSQFGYQNFAFLATFFWMRDCLKEWTPDQEALLFRTISYFVLNVWFQSSLAFCSIANFPCLVIIIYSCMGGEFSEKHVVHVSQSQNLICR